MNKRRWMLVAALTLMAALVPVQASHAEETEKQKGDIATVSNTSEEHIHTSPGKLSQGDFTHHYFVCTECGILVKEEHVYNCKYDENWHWMECDECGQWYAKEEHVFEIKYNETNHWKECEGCGAKREQSKHYLHWVIDKHSTETTTGTMYETCNCGYKTGNTKEVPIISNPAVLTARTAVWTGGDLIVEVDEKGTNSVINTGFNDSPVDKYDRFYVYYDGQKLEAWVTDYYDEMTFYGSSRKPRWVFTQEQLKALVEKYSLAYDQKKVEKVEINISLAAEVGEEYPSVKYEKTISVPVDFTAEKTTLQNSSGVSMSIPNSEAGNFQLQVGTTDGKEETAAIEKIVQINNGKLKVFDLSLLLEGSAYSYNGQFTSSVCLPIPEGWDMDSLELFYYNEQTKEVTAVPFTVDKENSLMIFETNHFSRYVLVEKVADESAAKTTKTTKVKTGNVPKTGDTAAGSVYLLFFFASALAVAGCVSKRKDNRF